MMQAAGGMGGQGGGIISSALQLIKEKERQGDIDLAKQATSK